MFNYKKFLVLNFIAIFSINCMQTTQVAKTTTPDSANQAEVDPQESGKKRIVNIMFNSETGISSYNKRNISYCETQSLENDLNIGEITKFFGCKTLIGEIFLKENLKNPVNPKDRDAVIIARQNIIKTLVENPDLKLKIDQLLDQIKQEEQAVITLFSDNFVGKTCPELQALESIKKQSPFIYPLVNFMNINPTGKIVSTGINLITVGALAYAIKHCAQATYLMAQLNMPYGNMAAYTAYLTFAEGIAAYTVGKDYVNAREKRNKLHSLNRFVEVAGIFEKIFIKYNIENQFKISSINNIKSLEIINELKQSRYEEKNSYVFMTPMVHSFLYKLYQEENNLAPVFACIAEIDAYNAIATKIIESQSQNNKFCFVKFVDQEKPAIRAKGFWNVLVKNPIVNDISESKNIILTGPNAGGKTTAIRALLQNIVLGQTYGIAAAESFEFTLFDIINSYLNISDDILNGQSLFASEVKRAQSILQILKDLDPSKKFFFALDELFTGTAAENGEVCAYQFIKRVTNEFKGTQFIYATHFNKLKELGSQSETCTNYKVGAPTKNSEGKLVYPFTFGEGANTVNVALDIANEANLFA